MYFGTLHWKRLLNGYSAWAPPYYAHFVQQCCAPVPSPALLADLARHGVTHLLIHLGDLPPEQRRALRRWERSGAAELVYAAENERIYRLPDSLLTP
jgi:hypothetical protein